MVAFLMVLFVILCFCLATLILIQQGKGDMGLGSLGGSSQMLFGGSGGQNFFEKTTWVLGAIFMFGALALAVLKSGEVRQSRIQGATAKRPVQSIQKKVPKPQNNLHNQLAQTQTKKK